MSAPHHNRRLAQRPWVPRQSEELADAVIASLPMAAAGLLGDTIEALIRRNAEIHDHESVNLNPATNTMSPRALAALSSGLGTRTSLGYIGAKYEMGLEAIEQIEVIAAELAAVVFDASYAEVRVPSGAMANLYAFMATTSPGDAIIVPPANIAGHVTHHAPGAAGLYGLDVHEAPVDAERYTVDVEGLATMADVVRPRLITIGSSLNLTHHDVPTIRQIADACGATVLFDAAHLSGPIAGKAWPNPLHEGAHIMTMSTYKSLAGPPAGLIVTNESDLAERIDAIAFPGLTANFDVAKTAALAITLAEWADHGIDHANAMLENAGRLAAELLALDVPIITCEGVATRSHAFAVDARDRGGGTALAHQLRLANLLTSAIGLPIGADAGLRIGTNELTRLGATPGDMLDLAALLERSITATEPMSVAPATEAFRRRFHTVHFAEPLAGQGRQRA